MYTIKQVLFLCCVVAFVSIGFGFLLGSVSGNKADCAATDDKFSSSKQTGENTFQAGWNAAKKRLAETGFFLEDEEITELTGTITALADKKIKLKTNPLSPLANPELDTRVVIVDNQTKFYFLKQKNNAVYEGEMLAYEQKMNRAIENENIDVESIGNPPDLFKKTKASFSDLKENQNIKIIANQNIKESKSFAADEILFEEMISENSFVDEQQIDNVDEINSRVDE